MRTPIPDPQVGAQQDPFALVYWTYRGLMFYTARQILNNDQDAEDAVQNAFCKIAAHMDKIRQPVSPQTKGWVVTIVQRQAINVYNKKKRQHSLPLEEDWLEVASPPDLDGVEAGDAIAFAMASLPAKYRQILLLKYDLGFTNREIGDMLSMRVCTVAKTLQRGKAQLRNLLKQQGVDV